MLLIFCENNTIYSTIKKAFKCTEYVAHDMSMIQYLNTDKALPFTVSINTDATILLCPPQTHHQEFTHTILGMFYMSVTQSNIVYIDSIDSDKNLTSKPHTNEQANPNPKQSTSVDSVPMQIPLSLVPNNNFENTHSTEQKISRPLYFDILTEIPHATTIPIHSNPIAHTLLRLASKLWDSHLIHMILLPDVYLNSANDITTNQLTETIQSFMHPYRLADLSKELQHWFTSIQQQWNLTRTEAQQLKVLIHAYAEHQNNRIQPEIETLLQSTPQNSQHKTELYTHCKKLLLQYIQ